MYVVYFEKCLLMISGCPFSESDWNENSPGWTEDHGRVLTDAGVSAEAQGNVINRRILLYTEFL